MVTYTRMSQIIVVTALQMIAKLSLGKIPVETIRMREKKRQNREKERCRFYFFKIWFDDFRYLFTFVLKIFDAIFGEKKV